MRNIIKDVSKIEPFIIEPINPFILTKSIKNIALITGTALISREILRIILNYNDKEIIKNSLKYICNIAFFTSFVFILPYSMEYISKYYRRII